MQQKNGISTRRMVSIAFAAVLICVCSWITLPFAIPFTLQTFAVFCALLLLGGKDGTAAIGLYLAMGCLGLPVFSGFSGGVGHLLGPTGGYILGFLLSGFAYWFAEPLWRKRKNFRWFGLLAALLVCYAAGTFWYMQMYTKGENNGLFAVLSMCVFPYVFPDCLKALLAVFVCDRLQKIIKP